jgi:hypothetical protein
MVLKGINGLYVMKQTGFLREGSGKFGLIRAIISSEMAKIQVVALNLFLVCIKYSSLPTLFTTYRRLAPSLSRSERRCHNAQSHNRRLNTKRHIESSVRRLFSGDSCILVPRVNFTNKAPPI